MTVSADQGRAEPESEVLRVPDFKRLWFANGFRFSAAEVASFALPLTAVTLLHANPFEVSLVFVFSRLGYLLVGLPAGVWVDRWNRKAVLLWSDLLYAVSFASIPFAYAFDALTVPHLVAVAFAGSLTGVFFDVAHNSVLPQLLPKRQIANANARLQTSSNAIMAVSPGAAGLLTRAVPAPLLYLFAVGCHLLSALLVKGIHPAEPDTQGPLEKRNFRREVIDGLRVLFRQPLLRLIVCQAALNNLGAGIMLSMLPVFLLEEIGVTAWVYGLLSTLGAVAGVVASLLCPRLRRRFGEIRMTMVFSALAPFALLAAPLGAIFRGAAVPLVATAQILIGFVVVGRAVAVAGLRARVTPLAYMGRVTAANGVVTQGATPLGGLLGGVIAGTWSTTVALWAGVLVTAVPVVVLLRSPLRSHRTLPAEWEV
ncbi:MULTISPECIES: MFS transporter [unclassified Streptomyces]|uniref:MFS transporter n=1 Tax=unclassified Streptomyces TaxID=2593676 RepID=UPI0023655EB6|nr:MULTISPECIES: MFS transporter [unclassified Streptomyces]MDF3142781.1 MFS transporter [Streptomyces sp. T21Q-yed]WDF42872.1 MFS transporter [Streptomyces sp. T12]